MKYIALLRGINVGGHHKVPMAELKKTLTSIGFDHPVTLLNSGNIIFERDEQAPEELEAILENELQSTFGFSVPTIIRTEETLREMLRTNPFQEVKMHKNIRRYVTFLKKNKEIDLQIPWYSDDRTFMIVRKDKSTIFSVLDVSLLKTPKAMQILEELSDQNITTRNWNTIEKIGKKLDS
ncbi:DUF1697 domain-containing protein [Portibacter marinus]|uniref:DUF1697 domain-containing protein n=1 Tax=Portibacter marinus TaxID=2898660 RepID=UPI001F26FCD4|nr:DUF1697 domain-containing protein [Portibacter marinus]